MHLYIEQNTGLTEPVSSGVIKKLYDLAVGGLDDTSNLIGTVSVDTISQKIKTYLESGFSNFHINATNISIEFDDPTVTSILEAQYGDLTASTISSINNISTLFKGSSISNFGDMDQLTSVSSLGADAFHGCSNLTTINLSRIQTISYFGGMYNCACFYGCSNLKSIYAPILTQAVVGGDDGNSMFHGCSKLESIDMPNLTGYSTQNNGFTAVFNGNNVPMLKYINFGHYYFNFGQGDAFHAGNFANLPNLLIIDAGDNITQFTDYAIQNCTALKAVVIRNSSVLTFTKKKGTVTLSNVAGGSVNAYFYVPDNLVTSYQAADNWRDISDRILGISNYDKDAILASA